MRTTSSTNPWRRWSFSKTINWTKKRSKSLSVLHFTPFVRSFSEDELDPNCMMLKTNRRSAANDVDSEEAALHEFDFLTGDAAANEQKSTENNSNSQDWEVDQARINRLKEEYKRDRHVKQHAATTITNATSAAIRNSLLNNGSEEISNEQRTSLFPDTDSLPSLSLLVDSMMFRSSKGFMENNTIESLDELARVTVLNDNEPQYEVREHASHSFSDALRVFRVTPTIHRTSGKRGMSNISCEGKNSAKERCEGQGWFRSHLDGVRCVAFHPVESMVITGSEDRTLKLWNLDKAAMLRKSVSLSFEAQQRVERTFRSTTTTQDLEPIYTFRRHT